MLISWYSKPGGTVYVYTILFKNIKKVYMYMYHDLISISIDVSNC